MDKSKDKYFVYRPLLNLISESEGTFEGDNGRQGYNETLGYGAFTDGDHELVSMTMSEIDKLQRQMLKHPDNNLNSSALGLYQVVRRTRKIIQSALGIPNSALFDRDMQDRMACFLLGQRGIDKWLAGRMTDETLLRNLAQEWASLPMKNGLSYYGDGDARVSVHDVMTTLEQVKRRHQKEQPRTVVVPEKVEKEVRSKMNWLALLFGSGGIVTEVTTWLQHVTGQTMLYVLIATVVICVVMLLGGEWIVHRVKSIRKEFTS